MKNNWNKTVNDINRERYTIPAGWDTKEQVAESLQCSPDRVADLLKPGIQAGQIERQDFPVWDEARRLTTRVVCYREKPAPGAPTDSLEHGRVIRALTRDPSKSDVTIAKNTRSTVAVVQAFRKKLLDNPT